MNRKTKNIALKHARIVRRWAEAKAKKGMRSTFEPNLCGWCAIASAQLAEHLASEGLKPELHWFQGFSSHVFLVVEDHVVDVTATQFEELSDQKIVIMHQKEADQYYFYQSTHIYNTPEELRKAQKNSGWPSDQIAYKHLDNFSKEYMEAVS